MKTVLDGACKFCGQIRQVEVEANCTNQQIIEAATMSCSCNSAMEYKMTVRGKKRLMSCSERIIQKQRTL